MKRSFYLFVLASFCIPDFSYANSEEDDKYLDKLVSFIDPNSEEDEQYNEKFSTFTDYNSDEDEHFFENLRTFNDANVKGGEQFYKKLRKTAANCTKGQIIKRGDGCNKCTCVWTGIISCKTNGCPLKKLEQVEKLTYDEDDEEETIRDTAKRCIEGVIVRKNCMLCQCMMVDIMGCVSDPECYEKKSTRFPAVSRHYDY